MSDRKYNVICADDCFFESMTKEQILAAIAEATGKTPTDVDAAFISKIRELNASENLTFWVGTTAEYNSITEKVPNCFYILTDDTTEDDIMTDIEQIKAFNEIVANNLNSLTADVLALELEQAKKGVELFSGSISAGDLSTQIDIENLANYNIVVVTEGGSNLDVICRVKKSSYQNILYIYGVGGSASNSNTSLNLISVSLKGVYNENTGAGTINSNYTYGINLLANPTSANPALPISKIIGIM